MKLSNPFKKSPDKIISAKNQKIIDNIKKIIQEETDKNMKIISEKKEGWVQAREKVDFIREIYRKMNLN